MKFKLPLTLRLLLFNVLVLFLPVATLLYLDTYESQQLNMQEQSMVQQARVISAALQDRDLNESRRILENLDMHSIARIRVVDNQGRLISDSARIIHEQESKMEEVQQFQQERTIPSSYITEIEYIIEEEEQPRENLLYQVYRFAYQVYRRYFIPPSADLASGKYYSGQDVLLGVEIQAALEGHYGSITRISTGAQRSVNLYSALPIYNQGEISGAVLVNQSTYRILSNLYKLRLDIIRIFSLSLILSLVISLLLSAQLTRPIVKLSQQAEKVLDQHGRFTGHFPVFRRRDELGDLSRSLQLLSLRLEKKMDFIDSMTADLVHELKNPLSSLASSLEILVDQQGDNPFVGSMKEQVRRMDGLLNRMRELTQIEQDMEGEKSEEVDLSEFLKDFLKLNPQWKEKGVELQIQGEGKVLYSLPPQRLSQVLINLLDNAHSFSPQGEEIVLHLDRGVGVISVMDRGPGIPLGNQERIFNRFFSDREKKLDHSGLGLAIVKAIMLGLGGVVEYQDRPGGGSTFKLSFQ